MAGERINIATLELDVQQLIKSAQESKKSILELRAEQAELAKQGQQSSAQFIRNEVEIRRLGTEYRTTTAAIQAQVSEGGRLQNSQMAIAEATSRLNQTENEYISNNKTLKALRADLNKNDVDYKKNLDDINSKIEENNKFLQDTKAANEGFRNQISGAIKDTGVFGGALGALKADYDNVINVTKAFQPIFDNMTKRFEVAIEKLGLKKAAQEADNIATEAGATAAATNTAATEAETAATTANTIASQSSTIATAELATAVGVVATEEALLTGETAALATVQVAQAGASVTAAGATGILSGALAILGLILQALGIGLIIAAIVLLVAAFKNFTPIVDKVEQVMAGVGAVFKVVTNAVTALITGAKSLGDVWSSLTGDMDDAYDSAVKLKKAQQDLEDAMALQEVSTARNRAEINRLNIQAKDRTKTEEERLALLDKASKLETDDFNARKANSDEQLRIAQEQIRINADLTDKEFEQLKKQGLNYKEFVEGRTSDVDDMFNALKDAQLKSIEIDNEYYNNLEKNINKQNKLIDDQQAKKDKQAEDDKKRADDLVKAEADRQKKIQDALNYTAETVALQVEAYKQAMEGSAKSVDEQIRYAETLRDKQIAANQAAYNASKKTSNDLTKLQLANGQAQLDFVEAQKNAVLENAETEYSSIVANNQSKLDANKFLNDEMVKQELERLKIVADAERDRLRVRFDEGVISEQEYNAEINRVNSENQKTTDDILQKRKDAETQRKLTDLENQRAANQENFLVDLQLQAEQDDIKRQQEIAQAEKTGADISLINAKYDAAEKQRAQDLKDFKYQQRADFITGLKGLVNQESKIGKALAIAEIVNNTVQNAAKAFNQAAIYAANPLTAPLAVNAAVQGGIIIATGALQVGKTVGAKLEKGGLMEIGGRRHSAGGTKFIGEDGTQFEAERGELIGVLNRSAAAAFMNFNNLFMGGSAPVSSYLATGGIVDRTPSLNIDINALADAIGQKVAYANSTLPNPVVTVQEIAHTNDKLVRVDDVASY